MSRFARLLRLAATVPATGEGGTAGLLARYRGDRPDLATLDGEGGVIRLGAEGGGPVAGQSDAARRPRAGNATLAGRGVLVFDASHLDLESPLEGVRTAVFVLDAAAGGVELGSGSALPTVTPLWGEVGHDDTQYSFLRTAATDYDLSVDGLGYRADTGTVWFETGASGWGEDVALGLAEAQKAGPGLWAVVYDQPQRVDHLGLLDIVPGGQRIAARLHLADVAFFGRALAPTEIAAEMAAMAALWGRAWSPPP